MLLSDFRDSRRALRCLKSAGHVCIWALGLVAYSSYIRLDARYGLLLSLCGLLSARLLLCAVCVQALIERVGLTDVLCSLYSNPCLLLLVLTAVFDWRCIPSCRSCCDLSSRPRIIVRASVCMPFWLPVHGVVIPLHSPVCFEGSMGPAARVFPNKLAINLHK